MALEELMDPEVRERVTALLYELLPEFYRVQDTPPRGQEELRRFLRILAAPLAVTRQSVESLHADLFIDSCSDDMLPALAEMLGTALLLPEAASNRRELRSTSAWRRRKGTVQTQQSLASELLDMQVTTREGWQRLIVTQDVNLLRPERTVPQVREALLAEQAWGPREAVFRTVDVRNALESASRYHPRTIVHWTHPTRLFPLRRGSVRQLANRVYAFHPLGVQQPLRVDLREGDVRSDRVPPEHFARQPEAFFGREGGFTVRICGLPAAMGPGVAPPRQASTVVADVALLQGGCRVNVLEQEGRSPTGVVRLDVVSVELTQVQGDPSSWRPNFSSAGGLGGVDVLTTSTRARRASPRGKASALATVPRIAMIRLSLPSGPIQQAWFPGATVEVAGFGAQATRASAEPALAAAGFLRGALVVRVPGMWVRRAGGPQFLFLTADGSVYPTVSGTEQVAVRAREQGGFELPGTLEPLAVGPGPVWPASAPEGSDTPLAPLPSPLLGPALLHGGRVLGPSMELAATGTRVALAFAAVDRSQDPVRFLPLLRLEWQGSDWANVVRWRALDANGRPAASVFERLSQVARNLGGRVGLQLAVRLEGERTGLLLTPCELAWVPEEGEPLLLYLPELSTTSPAGSGWGSEYEAVSPVAVLHTDGSSRWLSTGEVARSAYGAVAPIAASPTPGQRALLQRRRLRGRRLQPSVSEARAGFLDVDPEQGLFALDASELAQGYPPLVSNDPPYSMAEPQLMVDYQDGATSHVGARSTPREPLLREPLPAPTRRVARFGPLKAREGEAPVYPSLALALQAVAQAPVGLREVIQFEDSATYVEWLTWLGMSAVPERLELVLQAAEGQRPVLDVRSFSAGDGTRYRRLTLRGLYLTGVSVPLPADEVVLQLCTVAQAGQALVANSFNGNWTRRMKVWRCITGRLELQEQGALTVEDSVVDAGGAEALAVGKGRCELERVTVLGSTKVRTLEASETLFDGPVEVEDRFQGCIRYSRVPQSPASLLPRRHRLVEGGDLRFVSRDRHHPGYARLTADTDVRVLRGAEDGSELGAFHHVRLAQRYEALAKRLEEYTPAGLTSSLLRLD